MLLKHLSLQNFRNYDQSKFDFSAKVTVVIGPNTSGKTNLLDSIYILSAGRSFVAEADQELIRFGKDFSRIRGFLVEEASCQGKREQTSLEVLISAEKASGRIGKKFFVNDIAKRRLDFSIHLPTLLFTPVDIEVIIGGPSHRRNFLDQVLDQIDYEYKKSLQTYSKALRQRNALLEHARQTGTRLERQFQYWDELLITNGRYIHEKRQEFLDFINSADKRIIQCEVTYDHSIISHERLAKYQEAELGAAMTLVGPHRDNVMIDLIHNGKREAKVFASRGQQRLIILQLKLLQLEHMKEKLSLIPLLLLDDIFSELDASHIDLVSQMVGDQQTIITTTHEEFINKDILASAKLVVL